MSLQEDPRVQHIQSLACTALNIRRQSFTQLLEEKETVELLQTFLDGRGELSRAAACADHRLLDTQLQW